MHTSIEGGWSFTLENLGLEASVYLSIIIDEIINQQDRFREQYYMTPESRENCCAATANVNWNGAQVEKLLPPDLLPKQISMPGAEYRNSARSMVIIRRIELHFLSQEPGWIWRKYGHAQFSIPHTALSMENTKYPWPRH